MPGLRRRRSSNERLASIEWPFRAGFRRPERLLAVKGELLMNTTTTERQVVVQPRPFPWGIIVFAVIILALGGWAYLATRPHSAIVTQRDIIAMIPLDGEVIAPPSARADVMAPYRAPVDKVKTSVGSKVERGDVLVELSMPA